MSHTPVLVRTLLVFFGACAQAVPASSQGSLFPDAAVTPQLLAPGEISTGDDESHASVYPDGHTLYFLKNTPSFDFYTIVYSEYRDGHWSTPRVAPFSGQY
jgi:hypothetical protein